MGKFVGLPAFYQLLNRQPDELPQGLGHFNIFRVEDLLLPSHKAVTYSRRNFFKISLVSGHSRIHYADQRITVDGPVLVFTNPMVPYFWERISEQHSGYVCIFTEAFMNRFADLKHLPVFQSAAHAVIVLDDKAAVVYETMFQKMFDELQGDYAYKYDLLRNLVMELIHAGQKMQPAAGSPQSGPNAAERISGLFAELLERQFPIELSSQVLKLKTPAAFAAQLHIHVNHLNKALKETTGQTTSQLINERVLEEARILLKSTNWTINEVAWSLGFEEPNHFSAFFRSRSGTTPTQFRQSGKD